MATTNGIHTPNGTSTGPAKKPFHIAVCGGGIGGLCTAIGLLHHNIPCTVYEAAPAFAEIGAGVSFGPNATRAMGLIDPAIFAGFQRRGTKNGWQDKKGTWFDFRIGQEEWEGVQKPGETGEHIHDLRPRELREGEAGNYSVHRAHFLDELVRLVPEGVARFGKRLVDIDTSGERMVLRFEDGTTAEADAVIGCDGVKSRTRGIVLGANSPVLQPTFSGKYAYRGLVPMDKAVKALGKELAENSQMYLGHHGHVLTFPIEQGATMNVVAFRTKESGVWADDRWVLPMKKEDLFADFEGWGTDVRSILPLLEKPDVWALFDHPPAPTYAKGRICLLGDSAHATTPHQGAGAGQAIEDAFVLTHLLGEIDDKKDIERVFRAYDAVRRPRSQKVVTTSREAGALYEFEDETLGFDLEKVRHRLEERYRWIWEFDLEAHLQEARHILSTTESKL